jgi:hypothetical protein
MDAEHDIHLETLRAIQIAIGVGKGGDSLYGVKGREVQCTHAAGAADVQVVDAPVGRQPEIDACGALAAQMQGTLRITFVLIDGLMQ